MRVAEAAREILALIVEELAQHHPVAASRMNKAAQNTRAIELPPAREYLKSMYPRKFEELCGLLFRAIGYTVEATPYVADGGVDAFMRKDGKLTLLQCKRVQGSVGAPILRDLFGSMKHHEAENAIVVTTGTVSASALRSISGKPIRIIELSELVELLETVTASVTRTDIARVLRIAVDRNGRARLILKDA